MNEPTTPTPDPASPSTGHVEADPGTLAADTPTDLFDISGVLSTTDPTVWAEEFLKRFGVTAADERANADDAAGLMASWFANAIETGRAAGRDVDTDTPQVDELVRRLADVDRALAMAGHPPETDVRTALRSEANSGFGSGRVVALTEVADALGLPRKGGALDDLERTVLDRVRWLAHVGKHEVDRIPDAVIRESALALAIESHGPRSGEEHDACFTARARVFERYLHTGFHKEAMPPIPPALLDTAPGLLDLLRRAGDEWGPLGVALTAAQLTDTAALVRQLTDARPTPTDVDVVDPETAAMTAVAHALTPLDDEARKRVIGYAHTRFYPSGDIEGPRTFYLDDLPATGDLVHVDGEDVPVTHVHVVASSGQLTWEMTTVPDGESSDRADEGSAA